MRFYEVSVGMNDFFGEEKEEAQRSARKETVSCVTDIFLDDYEGIGAVCLVEAEKRVSLAACLMSVDGKVFDFVEKFLKRLSIEYDTIGVKEISMIAYFGGLRLSERNGFIAEDYTIAEKLGLEDLFKARVNYFSDRLVEEEKTEEELAFDVEKYHFSNDYKMELERIFAGKTQTAFLGNPANYLMVSKEDVVRRTMARDLILALYKRGRLLSKRYTIINLVDGNCSLECLENFYRVNEGATLLLKVSAENFGEGEHARGVSDMKKICDVVRKKGSKVLTIFSMDKPSDKNRAKLENYMMGIPLIVFCDNLYRKETACAELLKMAAAEDFAFSNELLERVEKSSRSYTYGELTNLYNEWRAEYMSTEVFPEYSQFVTGTMLKGEEEANHSDAYTRLMEMIGLKQAKKVIDGAINYFKLQQEFRNRGIEFNRPAMHMCFTGSPGTAKTTVARLVAEILKDNGILSEGKCVEVGRSQLVGKFVGQSAPQVCDMFNEAKGSVLFIDEAYSLVEDKKGLYGTEAINTIVQEMENRREDTIVILAGYPEQMKELLEWNPGMKSRIAFHVSFDDYTEEELLDITKLLAKERGMLLDKDAEEKLLGIYAEARLDKGFGNGRFSRNMLEMAKFNQANRLMKEKLQFVSDEEMRTLTAEDFDYQPQKKESEFHFGFCA